MNYKRIYKEIIQNAKSLKRVKNKNKFGEFERHHVFPKCLGGLNILENLVLLTPREHFIAHKLLVEIYSNNKSIFYSYFMMVYCKSGNQQRDYKIGSREYERLKILHSHHASKKFKGKNNPMYGKTHVGVSLQKIKDRARRQTKEGNHPFQKKDKNGNYLYVRKGDKHPLYGIPPSEEAKLKRKITMSLKPFLKCPHCGLESKSAANMKRYHFDNCKYKLIL